MQSLEIYRGKKVLVTGHTGFKGGWLVNWLDLLGADVIGYALDPIYDEGVFQKTGIGSKISDYRGDIRDYKKLSNLFIETEPEIVFHLAAQPLVLESYRDPRETFEVNTQGTANILEAVRNTKSVQACVCVTTDKCYENKEWIWGYRENDEMGGHDPYSASKGAAELVIASYRRSFFDGAGKTAVASARAGNVIGGGDWSENRLIPDIIRAIKCNKSINIRNPNAIRPWQHVLEPLYGYLILGQKLVEFGQEYAQAWNFGPYTNQSYSVGQIVDRIIKYAKKGSRIDFPEGDQLHEANTLRLDITKACQRLKWKPELSIDDAVRYTVDWYFNDSNLTPLELTGNQIEEYQKFADQRA